MDPESILRQSGPLRPHELTYWLRAFNGMTRNEARAESYRAVFQRQTVKLRWDGRFGLEMD